MITLHNVTFGYGAQRVIEGLTHTFPDTGIFALMGPSGCGKTTLLRLLAELEKPSEGVIEKNTVRTAVAFQESRLLPWLNCEDNIKLVLSKEKNAPEMAQKWLKAFELDEAAKAFPSALSGGMRQRLSLARALAFGGDLVLLDEPFSALDKELKARIAPVLQEALQSTLTVMITHDPADAALLGATVLQCNGAPLQKLNP